MKRKNEIKPVIGTVVSNSNLKTITVLVSLLKTNLLYGKKYNVSKKFIAHSNKKVEIGQVVKIISTKPISKTKKYKLLEE